MAVLVTGGCGFIGSNFIRYFLQKNESQNIINLDALTYAGNLDNLLFLDDSRYKFINGNICEYSVIERVFTENEIDAVIHFAAESHVDRSISAARKFVLTNVLGTQNLLEVAKQKWGPSFTGKKFIHISTDEVYGSLGLEGYFREDTPIAPNSPYSASKASSDLIVRSYYETYGFPAVITRCSNNYGPYQYPEKLIPLMITNAIRGVPLPVYGDGKNVRDWLHVEDHCEAIRLVYDKGVAGQVYNVGGNNEWTNIGIVKLILMKMGVSEDLIKYVPDRLGHDRRYAIDASKIKNELGWEPQINFEKGIKETIGWYMCNKWWWEKLIK